ncbi:MFS transporter [Sandarakinorhabdus cyanobacteriorum]|uniref:MFS transporter n=1 Tax=Sandarakinorhabdus cyanobacteriorum TaxID=1981098 RepID=A0A255Y845_9SPHN|nr:MFS transporter [Sandarakinorhabdus cyanobacteriorum]OYQ25351.1 MFS transporter [Sandarakinorhabdus cyanobacteriorum]
MPVDAEARARRLLIALLFVGTALNYVDRQVLALLKPTLEAEFGWSDQEFAHLGSVFQLSAAFALLAVGWFVDRFGVRLAYGIAVAVWSAAGMAHAAAANVSQFVVARSVLAVAESVNTPAAVKAAATYLPLTQRSFGLGMVNTAPNIGAILTPLLIPPLALAFGWKAAFLVTGALGFVWLALWIGGTRRLAPVGVAKKAALDGNWAQLLSDRRTWTVVGAKALTDCVWWFVLFWSTDFLVKTFGLTQAEVGLPSALIFALAAVGAFSCGLLFPALLKRGMSINKARKTSMALYAVLILPIPLALQAPSAMAAALIIGLALLAHQGFSTNIFGLAADTVPPARVASVMALGGVAGNLTGTGIIELTGWCLTNGVGYWPMFAIAAGAYLTALAFIHVMQPVIRAADEG